MAETMNHISPRRSSSSARHHGALRIAGIYALFGVLWILFSDEVADALVGHTGLLTTVSMIKGWAFIAVTAVLLYALIRQYAESIRASEERFRSLSISLEDANRQLGEALTQEQAARRDSDATNQELEAFIYSISHDLRAPLNLIRQLSELALEQYGIGIADGGRQCLQQIIDQARHTDRLAEDLLTLSRTTRLQPHKQKVEMSELVRRTVAELQPQGQARADICISDLPAADGDPALLKQVWEHLISNAIKFTRLRSEPHIEIDSTFGEGGPVYYVRDNGVGFDSAQSDRLFRAFQRLHHADDFPGSGLGLAIVQQIIQRHGGRVWAEGEEGKGATFYFTLG